MKTLEKNNARKLREKGYSINQIVAHTKYSKASVSVWVRDIVLTKSQRKKLSERGRSMNSIENRRQSRLKNENQKRRTTIELAKKEIDKISQSELKLIGITLYMGEGAKKKNGTVALANSDPDIIRIFMRFLREICNVKTNKFYGHVHTFEHANILATEKYWSKVSGISRNKFYKTYTKPSSASLQKRKTLPYGTFDIYVNDTKLRLTILGWIEKVKELIISCGQG